uniref:DH domain-containing protein n=1 Tax=Timema cristinae TaxID=61476 RepID=A0A7R9H6N4_TIMCR|nr:unnamed protein product [Timema cristinae]
MPTNKGMSTFRTNRYGGKGSSFVLFGLPLSWSPALKYKMLDWPADDGEVRIQISLRSTEGKCLATVRLLDGATCETGRFGTCRNLQDFGHFLRLRLDPDLDLGDLSSLLDNSAARHKLSVRPRRKHTDSRQRDSGLEETRRLVTLLDQQVGGAPDGAVLARCAQPGALVWPSARDLFQARLTTCSGLYLVEFRSGTDKILLPPESHPKERSLSDINIIGRMNESTPSLRSLGHPFCKCQSSSDRNTVVSAGLSQGKGEVGDCPDQEGSSMTAPCLLRCCVLSVEATKCPMTHVGEFERVPFVPDGWSDLWTTPRSRAGFQQVSWKEATERSSPNTPNCPDQKWRSRDGNVIATPFQRNPLRLSCIVSLGIAAVRELVETEEEFGRDLQHVVECYQKPLDNTSVPHVVRENRDVIFSNFKQIADFHNTLHMPVTGPCAGRDRHLPVTLTSFEPPHTHKIKAPIASMPSRTPYSLMNAINTSLWQ